MVNGQTLFILGTKDGKIMAERRVVGGSGAGPIIVNDTAYLPMLNGQLKAYTFGAEHQLVAGNLLFPRCHLRPAHSGR